jgi:hypothetical protein
MPRRRNSGSNASTLKGKQVRRNRERFPEDFIFQLTAEELAPLRSQIATSKATPQGRGGRRYLPYAFTEHGAIVAASILNSPRAVKMSVHVVRAFAQLRELLSSNRKLARRFAQLETRLDKKLTAHDRTIAAILSAIPRTHEPAGSQAPADRFHYQSRGKVMTSPTATDQSAELYLAC